ncbi:M20 metallopeptidase family protein [Spirochaeta isovalerica]|uniref:Hippurate hydrolase n=1 Tax=Spirochaeta isovalerica TaxID=150 RepID=A0A841RBJ1_9SPIO|nr:M20 family metallopeptidase [Spirochaeta isovalerica]MBB6480721.1 hippurate hydrolase [Spirochaeta isovalerica]
MNDFYSIMDDELNNLIPGIKELRKELHRYPEIAWSEKETRRRLVEFLSECGMTPFESFLGTDLVYQINGEKDGKALLLRSDMDALKQKEKGNIPWKSLNEGAAHNCGHDGHMSMLCGAALLINRMVKRGYKLPRPVRFVFQPAEEIECGGSDLVDAGVLDDVGEVLAIHGWPALPKGEIFSKSGPFFAAAATFVTKIKGIATHGALPMNGLSPFPSAARMIDEIELIAERYSGRAVVSSCMINGGSSENIIPGEIEIRGTIRYYHRDHFSEIQALFERAGHTVADQTACGISTEYISKYKIPLYNSEAFLDKLSSTLKDANSQYSDIPGGISSTEAKTVSEDFSFYTDKRPGALVLLGLGDDVPPLHAQNFDFPDDVLSKGVLLFTEAAFHLRS